MAIIVEIKNGMSIETALKKFKKKVKTTNLMQEIKEREYYEKPSIKRRRIKINAINRQRYNNVSNAR